MSTPTLSLIIPCYNCAATLEDAVASIYRQELPIPFDVTMVDDGSTDGTYQLMEQLAVRFPNAQVFRHNKNRGGGAARNTAVANSGGDLIFCLDSDDILGHDFLRNLGNFWLQKQCDGVGISTSIKFRKTDTSDVAYITRFEGPGEPVRFGSLFDSSACSLLSTFLITRRAFEYVGGYPITHGFDTQAMAFRFLGNGLTAYTCPDTIYYHRVGHSRSYFVREAGAGRTHWNWFKILEEFLYLFNDAMKARILDHGYFPSGPLPTIETELGDLQKRLDIYAGDFTEYLRLGRDRVVDRLTTSKNKYDQFWVGSYYLAGGRHEEVFEHLVRALRTGFNHRIIYGYLLEIAGHVSGNRTPLEVSIQDIKFRIRQDGTEVESSAPPLPVYQRFENWLVRHRGTRRLASALKRARLELQRIRGVRADDHAHAS